MNKQYYCFISGLPDLSLDTNTNFPSILQFKDDVLGILAEKDLQLFQKLFYKSDHFNILSELQVNDYDFDPLSSFKKYELTEKVEDDNEPNEYLSLFIRQYKHKEKTFAELSWENQLLFLFYHYIININNSFLKRWFIFELNLTNVLIALNCRKHQLPLENQLIPINNEDSLYQKIKSNFSIKDFSISKDFDFFHAISTSFENDDILTREMFIDKLKWEYIEELETFYYFTIEKILAYTLKLFIIERWSKWDKEKGRLKLNEIINSLSKGSLELISV